MSTGLLVLVLGVLCDRATAAVNPKISFITGPEVVTNIGEQAELECRVENGKEYPINWIKIREERGQEYEYLPLSTGKTLAIKDPRIKLIYDSATSSYKLVLTDIQAIDAAKYQCQVIVGINNKISKDVALKVRLPASIQSNQTSALTVVEGEDLTLSCPATGFPTPRVEWSRGDHKLLPGTSSLTTTADHLKITGVRKEDRGPYTCTADNKVGTPEVRTFNVKVRFGPRIRVPRPRIHQAVRHSVSLVCEIEAYPAPSIFWIKNGVPVVNDDSYTVIHFSRGDTITASTVKISATSPAHYGTYECRASNAHGEDQQSLELTRVEIPIPEAAYGSGTAVYSVHVLLYSLLYLLAVL